MTKISSIFLLLLGSVRVQGQSSMTNEACLSQASMVLSCEFATPGIATQDVSHQGECLCYSASTWIPDLYDSNVAACYEYLSTANQLPASSSNGPIITTFCRHLGNILSATATDSASSTSLAAISMTNDPNFQACQFIANDYDNCAPYTSDFSNLPWSVQASCMCYSGLAFQPSMFDVHWQSCLKFQSTAQPEFYSSTIAASNFPGTTPCAKVGDVHLKTASPSPTLGSPAASTATFAGGSGGSNSAGRPLSFTVSCPGHTCYHVLTSHTVYN
jgi:hypothetical protein